MANFKGIIRFITETQTTAIVEQFGMDENNAFTSTGIGTGDGSNNTFYGTVTGAGIVEEGSLVFKVNGVTIDAHDVTSTGYSLPEQYGYIYGDDISITSTGVAYLLGYKNAINYTTGYTIIVTSTGATPSLGEAVTVSGTYGDPSDYMDQTKIIRGDFSMLAVGDIVAYNYDTDSQLGTGSDVTLTFA